MLGLILTYDKYEIWKRISYTRLGTFFIASWLRKIEPEKSVSDIY